MIAWIITAAALLQINTASPTIAHTAFDNASTYASPTPTPSGWHTTPTNRYFSVAAFKADIASGAVDATNSPWIRYDLEHWDQSPIDEQQHPSRSYNQFNTAAHAHGFKVMATPGRDLVYTPGSVCTAQPGETTDAAYIRCHIPANAARYSDAFEVQSQNDEHDVTAYKSLVSKAAAQARAANRALQWVMAGVSTNPPSGPATATEMATAAKSVATIVSGYWLNLIANPDGSQVSVAVDFLQQREAP